MKAIVRVKKETIKLGNIQYLENGIGTKGGYEDFDTPRKIKEFLRKYGESIPRVEEYTDTYVTREGSYYKCWSVFLLLKNGEKHCVPNSYSWRDAHTGESGSGSGVKVRDYLRQKKIEVKDIKLVRLIVRR